MEMQETRPMYYLLVTVITQLVLAMGALLVLAPTGLLGQLPLSMLSFLLIYNILIATLVAVILAHNGSPDRSGILKGGGLVLGHLVGLIMGAFAGAHYGGLGWAMGAAIVLYFVVGWLGSQLSAWIGNELDRVNAAALESPSRIQVRHAKPKTSEVFLFGGVIPLLFMAAAVFLKSSGLSTAQYPDALPIARLLLALLSILSILIPWVRRAQWLRQRGHTAILPQPAGHLVSIGLCMAPAIFGFLLFVAFGSSLAELSLFAVAASIAATTWAARKA